MVHWALMSPLQHGCWEKSTWIQWRVLITSVVINDTEVILWCIFSFIYSSRSVYSFLILWSFVLGHWSSWQCNPTWYKRYRLYRYITLDCTALSANICLPLTHTHISANALYSFRLMYRITPKSFKTIQADIRNRIANLTKYQRTPLTALEIATFFPFMQRLPNAIGGVIELCN